MILKCYFFSTVKLSEFNILINSRWWVSQSTGAWTWARRRNSWSDLWTKPNWRRRTTRGFGKQSKKSGSSCRENNSIWSKKCVRFRIRKVSKCWRNLWRSFKTDDPEIGLLGSWGCRSFCHSSTRLKKMPELFRRPEPDVEPPAGCRQ